MKRALGSTAGQTATHAGATAAASAANGLSKGLLAAVLSVSNFGAFAVGQTILMYASMFCEFGLFLPAARACAVSGPDEQHEIVGAAFVLFLPVAAVFVLVILTVSLFVNQLFHVDLADALRITAPLAIGWPFAYVGLQLAQGVGRLHVSALHGCLASALFLCALIGTRLLTGHTTVTGALVLQSLTLLAGGGALLVWLGPRFVRVRERIRILVHGARAYGFQVYVGRVLSVGTYNMDVLMLAALTSARVVANYALAGAIASAVGLPVTGLGNALSLPPNTLESSGHLVARAIVGTRPRYHSCYLGIDADRRRHSLSQFIRACSRTRRSSNAGTSGPWRHWAVQLLPIGTWSWT